MESCPTVNDGYSPCTHVLRGPNELMGVCPRSRCSIWPTGLGSFELSFSSSSLALLTADTPSSERPLLVS